MKNHFLGSSYGLKSVSGVTHAPREMALTWNNFLACLTASLVWATSDTNMTMNELVEIVPCVYLGSYNSVTENSLEQGNIKFIVNVTKHMPPREVSSHM